MKKPVALPETNYILRYLLRVRDNESQFAETSDNFEFMRMEIEHGTEKR